ncbi:MAG TPA: aminoglycoside phosphotransferase [Pseudonocardiaceae bacterium]|jgi:maltokinase
MTTELADWMPTQRWFAGKNRRVRDVTVLEYTELLAGDPRLVHTIIEVAHDDGGADRYQLLLGQRSDLPDHLAHGSIGTTDGRVVYDAVYDHELTTRLLELIAADAKIGRLVFAAGPDAELDRSLRGRPVGAEQSNTSLVYGQRYILKLFRRLQPGLSPDLELHRALHEVGCQHIAAPLGWISGELDGEPATLATLNEFLPNSADGWAMATASVRDLMAEADLHAHEVGGDFAGEAHRLGHAVATVHADLDRALGHQDSTPELLVAAARGMHERLDDMLRAVPALAEHEDGLRAAFDAAGALETGLRLQRIHGDLHLGQALRTPRHWVVIDFEGEPAVPLARRRELGSPLRDVAGMLRSFDYAAHQLLLGHTDRQLSFRAVEWTQRNGDAFCDGYAEVAQDPRAQPVLLRALELDKAVYEVGYEAAHRPDWQAIPLASIDRLLAAG